MRPSPGRATPSRRNEQAGILIFHANLYSLFGNALTIRFQCARRTFEPRCVLIRGETVGRVLRRPALLGCCRCQIAATGLCNREAEGVK